jgi:hypothetical protein
MHVLFIFIYFLILSDKGFGQGTLKEEKKSITIKKINTTLKVDGDLSEPEWQISEVATNFCQSFPYDTVAANSVTEVRILYNNAGIYVGAVCKDSIAKPFVVQSLKRDFSINSSDAFVVTLDPLNDKTNGFSFGVNPYGVQREGLVEDRGIFGVTTIWDNKWFAEVQRKEKEWVVEMFIPFKSIRYKTGIKEWGINFHRQNLKINETSNWSRVPRIYNISFLPYAGKLIWEESPQKAGKNISFIPYLTLRQYSDYQQKINELKPNTGLNAKLGVTSSLNLDVTINPDFSQVEVDAQITNLSRFSLFFPERREFFIENSDLFSRFGFRNIRPFFSRQIGLYNGQAVPIIAGARLSGKVNPKWRIGIMDMQTEGLSNLGLNPQNYFVFATQRQVGQKSNISGILVNRLNTNNSGDFNRVAGIDYNFQTANNKIFGKTFFHHSFSPHQPKDAFAQAVWISFNTMRWGWNYNHEYIGENYNAEVGFVPRKNVIRLEPDISRKFYPRNSIINNVVTGIYLDGYFDKRMVWLDRYLSVYGTANFQDGKSMTITLRELLTRLLYPFDPSRTGSKPLPEGNYNYHQIYFAFQSNPRKVIYFNGNSAYGTYYNGKLWNGNASINFRTQPWGSYGISLDYNRMMLPAPYANVTLVLLSTRFELTFTRSIFFTTFLQYNTQQKNFNINARFQWRFAPMSDLFIVWTDNYQTENIFIKNRALVIKCSYWFMP